MMISGVCCDISFFLFARRIALLFYTLIKFHGSTQAGDSYTRRVVYIVAHPNAVSVSFSSPFLQPVRTTYFAASDLKTIEALLKTPQLCCTFYEKRHTVVHKVGISYQLMH